MHVSLEAGNSKETDLPLDLPEGTQPYQHHLGFRTSELSLGLCENNSVYCLNHYICYNVKQATGNYYRIFKLVFKMMWY